MSKVSKIYTQELVCVVGVVASLVGVVASFRRFRARSLDSLHFFPWLSTASHEIPRLVRRCEFLRELPRADAAWRRAPMRQWQFDAVKDSQRLLQLEPNVRTSSFGIILVTPPTS